MTAAQLRSEPSLRAQMRADAGILRRLLGYLAAHKKLFAVALLLYPLDALAVVLPPYLVRQILDVAVPSGDARLVNWLALAYVGALSLEFMSGFASQLAMSVLGQRAMRSLRSDLFAHVQRLPPSYYDRTPVGRLVTRLTNDVESLGELFASGAVTVLADVVVLIAVVSMMFYLNVELTLVSFLVVPPLVGLALIFQRFARRAFNAIRKQLARINAFLSEHLSGMSIIQAFGQQARTQREFENLNLRFRNANRQAILFDSLLFSLVEAIGTCAVAAMIWYGAMDMAAGAIGAGTLVAFIQYIRRFFVPIRDLSTKYTIWQSGLAASERIFEVLDEPVVVGSSVDAVRKSSLRDAVELRHVWFSYKETGEWILRDVDLTIRRGEHVALVGATGSGKTTILKLLNRLYDVQRGAVLVDGTDVRELHLDDLRRLFAVVLQDVHLFSGTIMENLAFADGVTEQDVRGAARAVQADAVIEKLPAGYAQPVQTGGANFSAGERQLLAFARALAVNPEVLVLDEATSNVDSETEARIQSALDVLLRERTAVVVAHRLSTIRKMDRIVVIHQGQIVEQGDHASLMARDGFYKRLVEAQF